MKYLLPPLLFISSITYAGDFEGCYSQDDEIYSLSSGESEVKTSFIKISKSDDRYFAQGLLWGANFHICSIVAPIEGSEGPLELVLKDDKLFFETTDPEYNIHCRVEISIEDQGIHLSDKNHHCSQYIFSCGARMGLNNIELPRTVDKCL